MAAKSTDWKVYRKEWYNDRVMETYINSPIIDKQNDLIPTDVLEESMDFYMKYGVYSYQHEEIPIGLPLAYKIDDGKIKVKYGIHNQLEMHDKVWQEIKEYGTNGGSSIRGETISQDLVCPQGADTCFNKINDLGLWSVSWVGDNPANIEATVTDVALAKSRHSGEPAKPSERRRGSSRNPAGTASGQRGGIKLSEANIKTLENLRDKHNEDVGDDPAKKANLGALKAVFRRGAGAFSTSHRPSVSSRDQWAVARVKAFLKLLKRGRPENPKYITDYDLLPKDHPKSTKKDNGKTVLAKPPKGYHWMITRDGPALMEGEYEPHDGAVEAYEFALITDHKDDRIVKADSTNNFINESNKIEVMTTKADDCDCSTEKAEETVEEVKSEEVTVEVVSPDELPDIVEEAEKGEHEEEEKNEHYDLKALKEEIKALHAKIEDLKKPKDEEKEEDEKGGHEEEEKEEHEDKKKESEPSLDVVMKSLKKYGISVYAGSKVTPAPATDAPKATSIDWNKMSKSWDELEEIVGEN